MNEIHAFFVMFAVLVLTVAWMHMSVITRFVTIRMAAVPDEYFERLGAALDRHEHVRRFVGGYRRAQALVAVLGAVLLGWFIVYMQRPDWDKRWVALPVVGYFMSQWIPMMVVAVRSLRYRHVLQSFLQASKRKASLKRRGLFDFVSPTTLAVAVLAYLSLIVLVLTVARNAATSWWFIGSATFDAVLTAAVLYRDIYGRKRDPFENDTARLRAIERRTRTSIFSAIAVMCFLAFVVTVGMGDLQRWMPFGLAVFLIVATLLASGAFGSKPGADDETARRGAALS